MSTTPIPLLDVDLLLALAWPNHVHHRAARRWFDAHAGSGWATCPITEAGFVRVSSNRAVLPGAATPRTALDVLARLCQRGAHRFWADDARLVAAAIPLERLATSRQVTDAHLLLVAARHDGRLATFDRGVASLVDETHRHLVELLAGP